LNRIKGILQNTLAQFPHAAVQRLLFLDQFPQFPAFAHQICPVLKVLQIALGVVRREHIYAALLLHRHHPHITEKLDGPPDSLRRHLVFR